MNLRAATLATVLVACSDWRDARTRDPGDHVVPLRWVPGHTGDSWDAARVGLWWSLSNLGAVPPPDEAGLWLVEDRGDSVFFELDLSAVGLEPDSEDALWEAASPLLSSDELRVYQGVDLGRFLMRTLYEPWQYFRVVSACPDLDDWTAAYLDDAPAGFAVTASQLVEGHRLLRFNEAPSASEEIALVAMEGHGSLVDGTFQSLEQETVDVMANGRQRYAVYDEAGVLQAAGNPAYSPAGQPGRCMWCHEDHLMGAAPDNEAVGSWLDVDAFNSAIDEMQQVMDSARNSVPTAVQFEQRSAHTWGELLGETFLHPSPARVAAEWGVSVALVDALVKDNGLTLGQSEEYPEFGVLLVRSEVDALHDEWYGDGYVSLPTLPSARELDPSGTTSAAGLNAEDVRSSLPPCSG